MMTYMIKDGDVVIASGKVPFVYDNKARWWAGENNLVTNYPKTYEQYKLTTKVNPVAFKMRFSPLEQVAIQAARKYDGDDPGAQMSKAVLDVFFGMIDDARLSEVDLNSQAVIDGLVFCVQAGLIDAARMDEITDPGEVLVAD